MKNTLWHGTVCAGLMLWHATLLAWADDGQRPHTYAFDQPDLVSAQRVFGVGNATIMLGEACHDFPEATAAYDHWLDQNQPTIERLTLMLADYYRIDPVVPGLRQRVAAAMHLKTSLNLPSATLADACPSLPQTLASSHYDLEARYQASLKEVQDPNYFNPKRKSSLQLPATPMEQTP